LSTINKSEYKILFSNIIKSNIDNEYSKMKINAAFNDLNWASFFATGDLKYVNAIISNLKYIDNRQSLDLYGAAATAKWSLCANLVDEKVKKYLKSLKDDNVVINDIFKKTPIQLYNE